MRGSGLSCGIAAVLMPAAAWAAEPADGGRTAANSERSVPDGPATADIIVTAQRRSERLVDVPISVDSISRAELETKRINSILDLSKTSTNLRFEGHTPAFQPTLRGVGSQVQGAGVDSNVAVYIDGFYQANNYGMGFDLPNVSNVQVLKGLQGTLFGRNATGGAILITTAEPSDMLTGRFKLSYSEYDDVGAQGNISGPLSEFISAGLSIYYRRSDGYTRNIITGSDHDAGIKDFDIRPDILIGNHDGLKLRLIFDHSYSFNATTLAGSNPDGYNIFGALGVPVATKPDTYSGNVKPINRSKSDGVYAIGEWKIADWVTLKSSTGFRHDHEYFQSEGDFSPLDLLSASAITDNKTFSQEFLFSGKSGKLDWVTGGNFYRNIGKEPDSGVTLNGVHNTLKSQTVKTNALAAFADLTYEALDGLFVTAGGRFSTEHKGSDTLLGGVVPLPHAAKRWNSFTPRAVIRYEIARDTNVYASYSKGFRSGAFTGFPPQEVDPEKLDAYEVGLKHHSRVFDLNTAAFYYNYRDAQVSIIDLNGLGQTLNAGNQHNYGGEVEVVVRPLAGWQIGLSGAYLHAKYTNFKGAPAAIQVPVEIAPGILVPGGWAQVSKDASGTWVPRSPKWTSNLSTSYDFDVGPGTVELSGNVSLTSHFFHFTNDGFREPGYAKIDLDVSFTTPDKHWRVDAFATNVTDHHSAAERLGGPFGTVALYTAPRVVGGSLAYMF